MKQTDRGQSQSVRRPRRRPARGTLLVIAAMMIGSAALRLGENSAIAAAFASSEAAGRPATEQTETSAAEQPDYEAILDALDERENRIAEREARLDVRAQAAALAESRIDEKLAELEAAEESLRATIAVSESAAENDLAQLTSVYENMGAEEAALLFSQMTPEFAAGFLSRMRPDSAAAVLSGLEPGQAYEISVILAGRNALAPSE